MNTGRNCDELEFDAAVGLTIAAVRVRQSISQAELAARVGVSQAGICEIETRGRRLSLYRILKVAAALKVTLAELATPAINIYLTNRQNAD